MAWTSDLRPAAFRGVRFGVLEAEKTLGRRIALHEYPYRDDPWAEDLGRGVRRHRLTGFLVENASYGGGDVVAQRRKLESAAEVKGLATLIHPTLGSLQVTLQDLNVVERWNSGRCFELQFTLIEGGGQALPQVLAAFGALLGDAAGVLDLVGAGQFASDVIGPLQSGLAQAETLSTTASSWGGQITSLGSDATNLFGSVTDLGGLF